MRPLPTSESRPAPAPDRPRIYCAKVNADVGDDDPLVLVDALPTSDGWVCSACGAPVKVAW